MIFKRPIIIGIHGLHNKPSRMLLQSWWKQSIRDGLSRISKRKLYFRFVLVYWANLLYPRALSRRVKDETHSLFIDEPYMPPIKETNVKPGPFRKFGLFLADRLTNLLFLKGEINTPVNKLWDILIRRFFKDLDIYYFKSLGRKRRKHISGKKVLRERLRKMLIKYKKRKILLIAHSMGSIIAYDVLSSLPPQCQIHTFVTIGSPLGFPAIKRKIRLEQKADKSRSKDLTVPDAIQEAWFNLSDLRDKVALDYQLKDDYKSNHLGIRVVDLPVVNDYEKQGKSNPHKSFGYLRTPELAQVVHAFLSGENYPVDWKIE